MKGAIDNLRSKAFLQSSPAASITPGFDVFVHDVIAAITTVPCFNVYYFPFRASFPSFLILVSSRPNPLNPTGLVRHLVQSSFILETYT